MTLAPQKPKRVSPRRIQRIEEEIAPLIARGLTIREVAKSLGISFSTAQKDCALLYERWNAQLDERFDRARGELIAKHDEIFKIAMQGYQQDTRSTKFLELASKELEALGRLLGQAGPSISLHAHQHNVAVTTDAVAALFQPLDADSYGAMVAARPLLPASEAAELESIEVEAEAVGRDDWSQGSPAPVQDRSEPDQPTERKNRKVQHPLRG